MASPRQQRTPVADPVTTGSDFIDDNLVAMQEPLTREVPEGTSLEGGSESATYPVADNQQAREQDNMGVTGDR